MSASVKAGQGFAGADEADTKSAFGFATMGIEFGRLGWPASGMALTLKLLARDAFHPPPPDPVDELTEDALARLGAGCVGGKRMEATSMCSQSKVVRLSTLMTREGRLESESVPSDA